VKVVLAGGNTAERPNIPEAVTRAIITVELVWPSATTQLLTAVTTLGLLKGQPLEHVGGRDRVR
jgi:hypothetical protein